MADANTTQGTLEGILNQGEFGIPCAELSPAAVRILESRYLLRDLNGELAETPRQMFERVARAIAEPERKWAGGNNGGNADARVNEMARRFFALLASLKFLPNSPTLMNAGKPRGQLSACFVIPIDDDLGSVFRALENAMLVHKTGGGTGFNFGRLRPAGDRISGSGGAAAGPMAFLKIFDEATQTVKQGGVRRGANMAVLPVSHPDIEAFIEAKTKGGITNFNLSVGVSDAFMEAVRAGGKWALVNPHTGAVVREVRARNLWASIAEAAWECGDPGVVFLDEINRWNVVPGRGLIETTNPCGEQPLLPFESCTLGSINLAAYVENTDLRWNELEHDIATAVRFLDDVIEANSYPVIQIETATLYTRKIGLGVMGWADALMAWGIGYDTEEACARGEAVMERINQVARRASESLAGERGEFPAFRESKWAGDVPRRNATVTTVAPTGTISIIAGVSSGIEPVFALAYQREALEGEEVIFVHPALKRALHESNLRSRKVIAKIVERGRVDAMPELPARFRRVLRTAMEIDPKWHIRMQAAFQKHVENGVSKTINLPRSATVAAVRKIYEEAFDLHCKGITVYRDLSKPTQVLRSGVEDKRGRRELLDAVDWLLDDEIDHKSTRKRVSVGLASLSRAHIRRKKS